ncbi:MAG: PEGA domain-containing protein [Deltaproteobacteria bacterium]|nr:PEGA domain-containing protein [Deltaproteobacteria bacterium]MBW2692804.1 PEGA domain-containing protein [Deltaproteobacteria bacterium]
MVDVSHIVLAHDGSEQRFEVDALPLSIGARAIDEIRIPVADTSSAVASIGSLDGSAFIQSAKSTESVLINGEPLSGSRRIEDGDAIRIAGVEIACSISGDTLRLDWSRSPAAAVSNAESGNRTARGNSPDVIPPTPFRPSGVGPATTARKRVRPAVVVTWGIGIFLLVLLWFSFTAVSVRLVVDPAPDEIDLPTALFGFHIGERYLLRPGSHEVVVEKEGYQPLEATIEITRAPNQRISLTLTKLPGIVTLISRPVGGAVIAVDGEEVGITPIEALPIPPGAHHLSFRAPRHLPATLEIEIEGAGKEQAFEIELIPAWAPISLASDPTRASVWIDGVEVGETPGRFELDAGTRVVELRLEGHNTWKREIEVISDQPQTLASIALTRADARLHIDSVPSDAQIVVDNASPGRTPMDLSLASEEIHEISLFKIGHELAMRTIELEPGEQRNLAIKLKPRIGIIDLIAHPAGATLSVDGNPAGDASQKLQLLASPHTLVIRKQGFQDQRVTVTPRPGFPQRIEIRLEKLGEPAQSGAKETVTAIGQELVLVNPGTFAMGSRRGEPGRRPNETERHVQLTRAFYIGAKEVTNRDFRQFSPGHAPAAFAGFELNGDDQPASQIAWQDAVRFCNWLSRKEGLPPAYEERGGDFALIEPVGTGYRLPTEAEWAWAARFAAGASNHRFPWGDQTVPPPGSGNYADASAAGIVSSALLSYRDGFPVSAPVGAHAANELGLYDVGGNVAEWVHDRYRIYSNSSAAAPAKDPTGPQTGGLRVIRGSSWKHAGETQLRLSYRDYGKEAKEDIGFRIARYQK